MSFEERGDAHAIEQLLAPDEEAFIRGAYRTLLGREPDPEGLGAYLEELRDGTPKIDLLAAIALSPEGRMRARAQGEAAVETGERIRALAAPSARSLEQLLDYQDEQFVRCAYLAILGRAADREGLGHYVACLRTGESKMHILADFRRSGESRARDAHLRSLEGGVASGAERTARALLRAVDGELRKYRWAHIPVVGGLLAWLLGVERDGPTQRRLRRLEAELFRMGGGVRGVHADEQAATGSGAESRGGNMPDPSIGASREVLLRRAPSAAPMLCTLRSTVGMARPPEGRA